MIFIVTKSYTIWVQTLKRLWNKMESYMAGWGLYRYPLIFYTWEQSLFAVSLLTRGEIRSHREARDGSVSDGEQPSQTVTVFPVNFSPYLSRPSLFGIWVKQCWLREPTSQFSALKTSHLSSILWWKCTWPSHSSSWSLLAWRCPIFAVWFCYITV